MHWVVMVVTVVAMLEVKTRQETLKLIWVIDAGDFDDDGGGGDDAVDIEIQNMASDASDDSGSSEASEDYSGYFFKVILNA